NATPPKQQHRQRNRRLLINPRATVPVTNHTLVMIATAKKHNKPNQPAAIVVKKNAARMHRPTPPTAPTSAATTTVTHTTWLPPTALTSASVTAFK
uniref:Uncharacterized protein n=1 Tax=Romanomermis culicivorax TaxID=13658 RepID=A0A915HW68_ROMCU